jgi:hypothetical protein
MIGFGSKLFFDDKRIRLSRGGLFLHHLKQFRPGMVEIAIGGNPPNLFAVQIREWRLGFR